MCPATFVACTGRGCIDARVQHAVYLIAEGSDLPRLIESSQEGDLIKAHIQSLTGVFPLGKEDHPPGTHQNGVLAGAGTAPFPTNPTWAASEISRRS